MENPHKSDELNAYKLILGLLKFKKSSKIFNQNGDQIICASSANNGVILSTSFPIGRCNRCDTLCYPSEVQGYDGSCPSCYEDLFEAEINPM